jgi:DNA-binding NtrC family response regulator
VRELENAVMRAMIMAHGKTIEAGFLPIELNRADPRESDGFTLKVGMTLEQVEREYIRRTLEATGGNKTKTAEMLAISRKALYNKLDRYGLK